MMKIVHSSVNLYFRLKISLIPPSLNIHDKIAIISPSGRVFDFELTENLALIASLNFIPVLGKNVFEDYFEGYHYAGNCAQRTSDLQWALDSEEIKAVWFARGGYGAVQLLDKINWTKFRKNPKWLIGYSDVTAIHNHVNNWGIPSLHAVTIKRLNCKYSSESFQNIEKVLRGEKLFYQINAHPLNKLGKCSGKLVGGNLSLLYSLIGSESELKGENLILFIEDWNENWYHLNRMLMSLKRSGILCRISGVLIGSFTQMDVMIENPDFYSEFDLQSYQIIRNFMNEFNIPLGFGFPAGHIGDNRALILGGEIEMIVTKETLIVDFKQ